MSDIIDLKMQKRTIQKKIENLEYRINTKEKEFISAISGKVAQGRGEILELQSLYDEYRELVKEKVSLSVDKYFLSQTISWFEQLKSEKERQDLLDEVINIFKEKKRAGLDNLELSFTRVVESDREYREKFQNVIRQMKAYKKENTPKNLVDTKKMEEFIKQCKSFQFSSNIEEKIQEELDNLKGE